MEINKGNVKKQKPRELQLVFPRLTLSDCADDECIVEFVRHSPKYMFPYRIHKEYDNSGDAA